MDANLPAPGPPLYRLTLTRVTSVFVVSLRRSVTFTGSPGALQEAYRKVLVHNLVAGWWAIPGLIWNPMSLSRNRKAMLQLRALYPAGPAVAGPVP